MDNIENITDEMWREAFAADEEQQKLNHALCNLIAQPECSIDDIDAFLAKGAAIESDAFNKEDAPLHIATQYNRKDLAEHLLNLGADVNAVNKNGETPLHFAMSNKYYDLAKYLIAKKANINSLDMANEHALSYAIYHSDFAMITYLIAEGANRFQVDRSNANIVHIYIFSQNQQVDSYDRRIIPYLISQGLDINHIDDNKFMPIQYAVTGVNAILVKDLLINGANRNILTENLDTLLHMAAIHSNRDVCAVLLDAGLDVYAQDQDGLTPRQLAEKHQNDDVAKYLATVELDMEMTGKVVDIASLEKNIISI